MLKSQQLDLDAKKATPFTLLLVIYRARLALRITGWEELDLAKQCEYLLSDKINSRSTRKQLIKDLISQEVNFSELSQKSYIRIHIKYILSQYYKQILRLSRSRNINQWSEEDIIISFISHLIDNVTIPENKKVVSHPKVWEFADYLRKYFNETHYNGNTFLESFSASKSGKNNDNKPTKGFGLQMMKTVCSKYGLKSGPYSKVKKQCNIWALKIYQQSQGNIIENKPLKSNNNMNKFQSIVQNVVNDSKQNDNNNNINVNDNNNKPKYSGNWSKFVTQIPADYHSPPDKFKGKSWFWFNDMGGFKWIPYKDIDCKNLNKAWNNNEKSCLVVGGEYRVEFDYNNNNTPSGNQYNNRQQNAGGRTVICADKKSKEIHGIQCAKNPF
eukprot:318293_1